MCAWRRSSTACSTSAAVWFGVAGLPGQVLLVALILKDKAKLLVHRTARFPGYEDVVRPHALSRSVGDEPGLFRRTSARFIPTGPPPPPPGFSFKFPGFSSLGR